MAKRGMTMAVTLSTGVIERQRSPRTYDYNDVIQMPMVGQLRSYHAGGLSSKELYKRQRAHTECYMREFRL